MRASNVPISVGSTKGRCVTQLVDDLRCLFLRWEENQGVSWMNQDSSSYTDTLLGTCHLQWCPTLFCQSCSKGWVAERLQRTEHNPGQPSEETGGGQSQRWLPAPSTCPGLSTGPRPAPALALEGITQQFMRNSGACTLHHHSPFPTKLSSQIFTSLSWLSKV